MSTCLPPGGIRLHWQLMCFESFVVKLINASRYCSIALKGAPGMPSDFGNFRYGSAGDCGAGSVVRRQRFIVPQLRNPNSCGVTLGHEFRRLATFDTRELDCQARQCQ